MPRLGVALTILVGLFVVAAGACVKPRREAARAGAAKADASLSEALDGGDDAQLAVMLLLRPAVEQLKVEFAGDREVLSLLERLKLSSGSGKGRHAAAFAFDDGDPNLLVDYDYFARIMKYAPLASYLALNEEGAGRVTMAFFTDLMDSVDPKGARGEVYAPFPIVPVLNYDYTKIALAQALEIIIALDVATWVVLHEIAHHRLGHLGEPTKDPTRLRVREMQADQWAFRVMRKKMGRTIYYLGAYLGARAHYDVATERAWGIKPSSTAVSFLERLEVYEDSVGEEDDEQGDDYEWTYTGPTGDQVFVLFPMESEREHQRFGIASIPFGIREGEVAISIAQVFVITDDDWQMEYISVYPTVRRGDEVHLVWNVGDGEQLGRSVYRVSERTISQGYVELREAGAPAIHKETTIFKTNGARALWGLKDGGINLYMAHGSSLAKNLTTRAAEAGFSRKQTEEAVSFLVKVEADALDVWFRYSEGKLKLEQMKRLVREQGKTFRAGNARLRRSVGDERWRRFDSNGSLGGVPLCVFAADTCAEFWIDELLRVVFPGIGSAPQRAAP